MFVTPSLRGRSMSKLPACHDPATSEEACMALFESGPNVAPPRLISAAAHEAEPGDEVICLDDGGNRHAVRAEYVLMSPDRERVTLVPRDAPEITVERNHPVMLLRGGDATWLERQIKTVED
jgi:hypothetical protein